MLTNTIPFATGKSNRVTVMAVKTMISYLYHYNNPFLQAFVESDKACVRV
jgi:hypothetical protein